MYYCYFFFQAEDGIRDWSVTGVQTCALPISINDEDTGTRRETRERLRHPHAFHGTIVRLPVLALDPRESWPEKPRSHVGWPLFRCHPQLPPRMGRRCPSRRSPPSWSVASPGFVRSASPGNLARAQPHNFVRPFGHSQRGFAAEL